MPRANRHFSPGHVWHLTHRCHRRDFLLKFVRDRERWIRWLREARKRFGVRVLNYVVTCNHIHLLVEDTGGGSIALGMQLVSGRVAQEYNRRKARVGAFWQDRYHATAVATDQHLARCLAYIDLNMVRAGAVRHPRDWRFGGYAELISGRCRNRIVAVDRLLELLELSSPEELVDVRDGWIDETGLRRDPRWTESLAVGPRDYVEAFVNSLSAGGVGPQVVPTHGAG